MHTLSKISPSVATFVLFSLFGKKTKEQPAPPAAPIPTRRVLIEGGPVKSMPVPPPQPPTNALRQRLLFHGLHEDFDPTPNVRTANMTCPSCNTSFRYFLNSDGKKTVMRCPGCAKDYRV